MINSKFTGMIITGFVVGFLTWGGVVFGRTYYVQPGDTLKTIAARYGITISGLQASNGLESTEIFPGQTLNISWQSQSSGSSSIYTVRPGDSLILLAQRFKVTVTALKEANNFTGNFVTVGQRLTIPPASGQGSNTPQTYRVMAGESLFQIAQKYGITVEALKQANRLSGDVVWPGQELIIPPAGGSGNPNPDFNLNQSDLDLLARLVSAESAGEPFEGQVAVAATILNRLKDPRYPKTIHGIIYQIESGRYQYSPVIDGRINFPAGATAYQAVQQALAGWDPSNGANGFYNPVKTTNQWVRSQPVTARIGEHVFFKY